MRKRPYFKMESAMTAILRDASGKMHHGILFARRLGAPDILMKSTPSLEKVSSYGLLPRFR